MGKPQDLDRHHATIRVRSRQDARRERFHVFDLDSRDNGWRDGQASTCNFSDSFERGASLIAGRASGDGHLPITRFRIMRANLTLFDRAAQ